MLFYAHAGLMAAAILLMGSGILIARYEKKKRWWLNAHKALGLSSTLATTLAFVFAVMMVSASEGIHMNRMHAYVGAAVLTLSLATATLGFLQLRIKGMGARIRPVHRLIGRIAVSLFMFNIVLGISVAGFL